ncbi:hypothetical protein AVEN_225885-1 [Araneus ventricosus]|uniref:Uncharacterized protein n=1 Tax=Araneus ventricosus TaxID=182803 RepID=A0A4Y2BD08_ARAVE|nr:hypothetical protein AVEN_225885-1 [Araneus ventricosus]
MLELSKVKSLKLRCFSDSDFATNRDDRVSMGGFITFIDETPISHGELLNKNQLVYYYGSRLDFVVNVVIICKVLASRMLFQWTKQTKFAWRQVWLVSATASTLQPRLSPKRFSSDDDDEMMTTFNTKSYCG